MTVAPDKKLGQHFLRDARVVQRVAGHIAQVVGSQKPVIEIGPGTGALTTALISLPNPLTLIEKDSRCVEALRPLAGGRATLLQADALEVSWPSLAPAAVVGNLPYNVGTEIVANLLHAAQAAPLGPFVFMLQKEVVQRLCAKPGSGAWGRLGVLTHLLSDARRLFDVPPGAFNPPPKVMSSVVEIIPLPRPRYRVDMKKLDTLLRAAFGQRRKMLRASLRGKLAEEAIKALQINPTSRPEDLSTPQLCALANAL